MLRLDKHLVQHAQQQRVSLIRTSLQAALLAILLLGMVLYFTQVRGSETPRRPLEVKEGGRCGISTRRIAHEGRIAEDGIRQTYMRERGQGHLAGAFHRHPTH